jgi:hypothetical protein
MGTEHEIDELFDAAVRLERHGEWDQAVSLYEQAVDKWPDRPEAVYAKDSVARLREMQKNSSPPPAEAQNESKRSMSLAQKGWAHRGIRVSIVGAAALLIWDAGFSGSCLMSLMVCPIWFLVSILKNAIQRPGWRLALLRIAVPALTLGLVLANTAFQFRISEANAERIITACEEYRAANGKFPETLDELVPRYTPSIPLAKYCLGGKFLYLNGGGEYHMLLWQEAPPYFRKVYHFETRRWSYMD